MTTEYHDEPEDERNSSWNKDPGLVQYSGWSRSRRWLLPALVTIFILIIVIAFGVSSGALSVRLGLLDESVSNLSLTLSSAHNNNRDAAKDVKRLKFSVESNRDQLGSVAESLKQLVEVESLSKMVESLTCSLNRFLQNRTEVSGCCPLQWQKFEDSCFFFSKAALSWHEAQDWCQAHQSQLLVLASDKDWDFAHSHSLGAFFWIGLTDESGAWKWVNGTPYIMNRRRWRPGQPDNWTGHGVGEGAEDCAHLHMDGRLNDLHCSTRLRFICQRRDTQS